jgi:phosphate uptake regulator
LINIERYKYFCDCLYFYYNFTSWGEGTMRRKVIQIAESTLLVSLPKKWADKQNIKKGDEINVEPGQTSLTLTVDSKPIIQKAEINLNDYGTMAKRVIHALYKKGIDEIRISFSKSADFKHIQESLTNETIGFEVMEQGKNHCVIRNVSGESEDFDAILRRIFLLLITMATEGASALENKDLDLLKNLEHLEESNNRLTTVCRRLANKTGKVSYPKSKINDPKLGPLYYIVEDLENIADEYKYMFQYVRSLNNPDFIFSTELYEVYNKVTDMIRSYYELFYTFDSKKIADLGNSREVLVAQCRELMRKTKNKEELVVIHHLLVVIQKMFNLTGPYLVLAL